MKRDPLGTLMLWGLLYGFYGFVWMLLTGGYPWPFSLLWTWNLYA